MPTPNATRFELAVYVEPKYVDKFRELQESNSESESLTLLLEQVIGAQVQSDMPSYSAGVIRRALDPSVITGVDVAEVYPEGES